MGGGKVERALTTDAQHVGVDVGDGDGDVGVGVVDVSVLQHTKGNISGTTGNIENALGLTRRVGSARIERGDKVVPEKDVSMRFRE